MRPGLIAIALLLAGASQHAAIAQERRAIPPKDKDNPLTELISGYYFTPLRMRALQDDDFDNPGYNSAVPQGEKLWNQKEGGAQKSCASCHGSPAESMREVGASYPKYQEGVSAVITLEQRVNICRGREMRAAAWPLESEAMVSMLAFIKLQSRGVPVNVTVTGPAQATFERGKALYNGRMGQLGMSCAHCHNDHYGDNLRDETLSQGHSNGFPVYQVRAQKMISLHERFRACFREMRALPFEPGSPELVDLELYLAWRGNGLPIETPAVRR
jgi:sulfur-oxidizing protein SoxA